MRKESKLNRNYIPVLYKGRKICLSALLFSTNRVLYVWVCVFFTVKCVIFYPKDSNYTKMRLSGGLHPDQLQRWKSEAPLRNSVYIR